MGDRYYYVYIMTNLQETTLYTGVTNNLYRRVDEHKKGVGGEFTRKYSLSRLVYYEFYGDVNAAIAREKQIKGGSRNKKVELINSLNPESLDLSLDIE
jgi:putative endonuclease